MAEKVEPHPKMIGLGERLELLRQSKGWSQIELARRSNVSQAAISLYENDERPGPPLAHVMRLADALEVPLQVLAYGRARKPRARK